MGKWNFLVKAIPVTRKIGFYRKIVDGDITYQAVGEFFWEIFVFYIQARHCDYE